MLLAGGLALTTRGGIGTTIRSLVGDKTVPATLLAAGLSSLMDSRTVCLRALGVEIQRLARTLCPIQIAATSGRTGQGRLGGTVLFLTL